ncbi:MAG: hypothetical protein L6R41_000562 [Letrouitia leprolyta]|nr:MAG: hypothetical protein L6R41_000562 [Letrouitia leprolyta]
MAPSSGHLLVPKALRIFKFAVTQAGALIRSRLPQASTGAADSVLQPIYLHAKAHPTHPVATLKQSRASALRKFSSQARLNTPRFDRPAFQKSKIGQAVTRSFGSPFASTLRPNLTGGALPRTAGGYTLGGSVRGVRHFSNTGGAQAQVIQNVSAGLRAFCVGGSKARFDGVDQTTGAKRFKAVSEAEDEALRKIEKPTSAWTKGTNLEFRLNPTITALSASHSTFTSQSLGDQTLRFDGFLDMLGVDFARALKDLSAILVDLKRLAAFGDLPIGLTTSTNHGSTLSVRFAGCDGDTVSRLCDEVGVRRGVIREDEAWSDDKDVEMALLFPFAPLQSIHKSSDESAMFTKTIQADHEIAPEQLEWRNMMSPPYYHYENTDDHSTDYDHMDTPESTNTPHISNEMPTPRSPSGYESLRESDFAADDPFYYQNLNLRRHPRREIEGLQGLESIHRFLAECDEARR